MGSLPYFLILALQVVAFTCNIFFIFGRSYPQLMQISVLSFFLSLLLMIFAIVRGTKGSSANCLTLLLVLVNILIYVTMLFTSYLTDFLKGVG